MKKIITVAMALFFCQCIQSQERTVTGIVSDASGLQLPGANIVIKGTTRGTQTDFDGKFSIKAKTGEILVFSFVGMKTTEIPITDQKTVDIKMEDDPKLIESYDDGIYRNPIRKKQMVSSAIQVVKAEDIKDRITVSGVITDKNGKPLKDVSISWNNGAYGTGPDGSFSIQLQKANKLVISHKCYKTIAMKVRKSKSVNLKMERTCVP